MHLTTSIVLLVVTKVFLIKLSLKFYVDCTIRHTVPSSIACEQLAWGSRGYGGGEREEAKESLHSRLINFNICVPEWDAKSADWLIFNQAIKLCSPGRACLQANRRDTFIGVEP